MFDLVLDFFLDLSFDMVLEILLPTPTRENHLEGLPKRKSFLQHFFAPLAATIVSLLDLPDKSAHLPLRLLLPRLEYGANRRQFLLIRLQYIQRALESRPQSSGHNLRGLCNRTQLSTAFLAL